MATRASVRERVRGGHPTGASSANISEPEQGFESLVPAKTVVIWGPAGATGKSSLALNLSDALANQGQRVLLIDADLVAPSLAIQLGVQDQAAGISAACKLAREAELTPQQLERVAIKIASPGANFALLPGITGTSRWPEITPSAIETIMQIAGQAFDWVVFDVASSLEPALRTDAAAMARNELTRHLLASCDHLIAVGNCDPVGVQRMLRQIHDVQQFRPGAALTLVFNRMRNTTFGINPDVQIAKTFAQLAKLEPAHYLLEDAAALDAAMRHGIPVRLAKRRSPYVKAVALLAKQVWG